MRQLDILRGIHLRKHSILILRIVVRVFGVWREYISTITNQRKKELKTKFISEEGMEVEKSPYPDGRGR